MRFFARHRVTPPAEPTGHGDGDVAAVAARGRPLTADVPKEFHRRMAAIIDAVQTGIWEVGVHDLVGYSTDFDFGQQRGLQTLVLKNRRRSAYVRLHWDTIMGDAAPDRQRVDEATRNAINELS